MKVKITKAEPIVWYKVGQEFEVVDTNDHHFTLKEDEDNPRISMKRVIRKVNCKVVE